MTGVSCSTLTLKSDEARELPLGESEHHSGKTTKKSLCTRNTSGTKNLKAFLKTNVFLKLKNANEKEQLCHPELDSGSLKETEILNSNKSCKTEQSTFQNDNVDNVIAGSTRNRRVAAGFTLAELLITLGIIGIVAAMTLPTLIQNHQKKQFLTQAKVVYNILNNALEFSKVQYGTNIKDWEFLEEGSNLQKSMFFFEKYLQPNLKVIEYCKTSSVTPACQHSIKMHGYNGSDFSSFTPQPDYGTAFVLSNSAIINIQAGKIHSDSYRVRILYDVNGIKKPNFMGKDVFIIELGGGQGGGDINKFLPYGYSKNKDCSYYKNEFQADLTCSQNSARAACLAYIMCNGWEIPDDYPW